MGKGALLLTALALVVEGCAPAPFPVLDAKLDALKGKPVSEAIDVLGSADRVSEVGDEKSYLWSLTKNFGAAYKLVSARCDISIFTAKNGLITHYSYNGNNAGCSRYAIKLDSNYHFVKGILD